MDGFKEAVQKLEELRDGGFIAPGEFEARKKELVDSFVLAATGGGQSRSVGARPISTGSNLVKLRGLPFTATEGDVKNFFFGFSLDPVEPVKFQLGPDGRQSGICFARFTSDAEAARALTKNKQYLGQRYIEVFPSNEEELGQKTAPPGATTWVRMRGLPFSATKGDIKAFFEGFTISDAGIFLVQKGGRPSGEAFVQFGDEYEAQRALLKDKEPIGMRYIELFLATREECDSAIARARMEAMGGFGGGFGGGFDPYGGAMAYGHPPPAPSYGAYGAGGFGGGKGFGRGAGKGGLGLAFAGAGGENVVRLRGLPFRATEQDVHAFLGGLNPTRVVIVYQAGRPSGEAYAEFRDHIGLHGALQRNRQVMGTRYIEVFQASRAELDAALAGAGAGFELVPVGYGGHPAPGAYGW